jgi:hypothetical protein
MAEKIPTPISTIIPNMTIHSPKMFMDLHRLKSDKFLCQSFSENRSIKSPTRTNTPPEAANATSKKIDPVVILFGMIFQ